jgi:hypothetical protein
MERVKIKTKNLKSCHINKDGSLTLGYTERHKSSGKDIHWHEEISKENVPFKLWIDNKDYAFRSVFLDDNLMPLINDIVKIDAYTKNHRTGCDYSLSSIYLKLKNGASIPFHKFTYQGLEWRTHECEFLY